MKYTLNTESRKGHPETCCCESHGIYVIREGAYFVSRHDTEKEAQDFIKLLERHYNENTTGTN